MLQDKRQDLIGEKRKVLLTRILQDLSRSDMDLYYRSTSEIAASVKRYIGTNAGLLKEEKTLLSGLTQRDIEVLLSLH